MVGPERLIAITGNDALTGFHGAQAGVGPRPRARGLGTGRPPAAAQGLRAAAGSPASTPSTRPTAPARSSSTSRPGTGRPRSWRPSGSTRRWMPQDVGGARRSPARSRARRPRRPGCEPGTPVVAGGGDQAANAVGVGRRRRGHDGALAGDLRRRVRVHRPAAVRAARSRPRLLPRRSRPLAHDVRDAVRGRQPALVPRRARAGRRVRRPGRGGRRTCRPEATGCCSCPTSPASAARTRIRSPAVPSSG